MTRRGFLRSTAAGTAAAAGAIAAAPAIVSAAGGAVEPLNVAIIGAGEHGRELLFHCMKLPGIRLRAVCDIWDFARNYAVRLLKKYKQDAVGYVDYRDMLAGLKDLDAVIVATPDGFHADQTIAALAAGCHVYCEKEMALTVADCRRMVLAARKAGRLLQVGRQHRSNARYIKALEYIDKYNALGRLTHVAGQWHGHKRQRLPWPKKYEIDKARLAEYGYDSMEQFRNWRWFSKFAAGSIASLGSHQVDVFNWFLHAPPRAVYASGGLDYFDFYELYDNVSCIYEWNYDHAGRRTVVRGNYEVLNTTEVGGFFEKFTGTDGELVISEIASRGGIWRDVRTPVADWEKDLPGKPVKQYGARAYAPIPAVDAKRVYWHHLKNFFDAIRGTDKLHCPGEVGFQAAVSVLKVNESMKLRRRIEFKPDDFIV
ncbi:MAG: Gfo/Idh/MocA family oxidoreductase [Planctomycetes bacterium]|nr:Gfo/Idh/MocA family oxidoreductase [Planctomycetota bacterium]